MTCTGPAFETGCGPAGRRDGPAGGCDGPAGEEVLGIAEVDAVLVVLSDGFELAPGRPADGDFPFFEAAFLSPRGFFSFFGALGLGEGFLLLFCAVTCAGLWLLPSGEAATCDTEGAPDVGGTGVGEVDAVAECWAICCGGLACSLVGLLLPQPMMVVD